MTDLTASDARAVPSHGVPFGEAMKVWARVAALSFGGPAGQIAVMHRIIVEEKKWIGEQRFLQTLNYCHLLPGPEAQQLAIYIGWLMNNTMRALAAAAFIALFFYDVPFPLVVLIAGLVGYFGGRAGVPAFLPGGGHGKGGDNQLAD